MKSREDSESDVGTAFQRSLGLRWSRPEAGGADAGIDDAGPSGSDVTVALDLRPDLCGPSGSLEGGVVGALVDVAGASACAMSFGGRLVATEHIAVSFLAPGRIGPVEATGTVLRRGGRDAVAEVRVVDSGHGRRLMAVALVTVRALEPRPAAAVAAASAASGGGGPSPS